MRMKKSIPLAKYNYFFLLKKSHFKPMQLLYVLFRDLKTIPSKVNTNLS